MEATLFNSALSPAIGVRPMLTLLLLGLAEWAFHLPVIPDALAGGWVLLGLLVLAVVETGGEFIPALASVQGWMAMPLGAVVQYVLPYLLHLPADSFQSGAEASEAFSPALSALGAAAVPMVMTGAVSLSKGFVTTLVDMVPDPVSNGVRSLGESGLAIGWVLLTLIAVPLALILAAVVVIGAVLLAIRLRRLQKRLMAGFSSMRAARAEAAAERAAAKVAGAEPAGLGVLGAARAAVTGRAGELRRIIFPMSGVQGATGGEQAAARRADGWQRTSDS